MITVLVYENNNGIYNGFRVNGHAGYAKYGQDIICSAVSILVINTMNSIETFTNDDFTIESDEETGLIECHITGNVSKESQLLLHSLFLGLQGIKEAYGEKFIKFETHEIWNK